MLIVKIFVNNTMIDELTAQRVKTGRTGRNIYRLWNGRHLRHKYDDGAETLSIKMLKCRILEKKMMAEW